MKKFNKFFIFLICVLAFISLFIQTSIPMLIGLGAVVTGNVLGNLRNRIGQVVAFNWKGINVFRSYVIPTYSNTNLQVAQRVKFRNILFFALVIKGTIIDPFWQKHAIRMSAFNAFMQKNLKFFTGVWNYKNVKLTSGTLTPTPITSATFTSGSVSIHFSSAISGNQDLNDTVIGAVYESDGNCFYISNNAATRDEAAVSVTTYSNMPVTNAEAYLFFYRAVNTPDYICSDNTHHSITIV